MAAGEAAGVSVATAREGDLPAVFRIEHRTFPEPWPYAAFEQYLGEPGFLVARDAEGGGSVVGFAVADVVDTHGGVTGHVKNLAVRRDRREEGIGSALLEAALDSLFDRGADSVTLEVRRSNTAARALYRSHGFEFLRSVEGYYEDGEDALVLVRTPSQGV